MLGKMKLQVLRRLDESGVVQDGLHVAVNGLVEDGFAAADDGYMLTAKGAAVLYLYDRLTDSERSLLMRVYVAMKNEEVYPIIHDADGVAPGLIDAKLLTWDGDNLYLTETAKSVWEGWVEFLSERQKYNEQQQRYQAKKKTQKANGAAPIEKAVIVQSEAAPPPPFAEPVQPANEDCVNECDSCIDREVLKLISAKYPKIAALRDSMLEQRRILKELGLSS